MRILCFHPALAPYRLHFFNVLADNADLHLVLLQRNLYSQKFDQKHLLVKLKAGYEYLDAGYRVFSRTVRFGFGRIIDSVKPEILIGYEASQTTLALLFYRYLRPKSRVKIWTMMDDSRELVLGRRGLRRIIRDFVIRHVDLVIVPSEDSKEAYRKRIPSVPSDKYAIVPIVHDTFAMRENAQTIYEAGRNWRSANVPTNWSRVLLFVGRLAPEKNLKWLIRQMKGLDECWGLVLVGDGEERTKLYSVVDELNLGCRVMFVGRQEGDKLYAIMSMADALVLCSTSEPYGAVVSEALQWGTPCIVSRNCGSAVLVETGKNGCVFEYNDSASFHDAIVNLPRRSEKSMLTVDLRRALGVLVARAQDSVTFGLSQKNL